MKIRESAAMRGLLRKLHPVTYSRAALEAAASSASAPDAPVSDSSGEEEEDVAMSSARSNEDRSRWSSSSFEELMKAFVGGSSQEPASRERKRDKLRRYLSRGSSSSNQDNEDEKDWLRPVDSLRGNKKLSKQLNKARSSSADTVEDEDGCLSDDFGSSSDSDDYDSDDGSLCVDGDGDYVFPPVVIPNTYRKQDRAGGITVAGVRVLFTLEAFKRKRMLGGHLQGILEDDSSPVAELQRESIVQSDMVVKRATPVLL